MIDPIGIAIIILVVPITADAVPAMCPIGVNARAFIFPNKNPKRKKIGIKKAITVKDVIFKLNRIKK